ncbi:MAG: nickel-dependent lactate racemase [Euryarchaeota archaeon]|nr:nickel-dependent lactate racemase [Euryarchaeota archaeon]
MIYKLHYGKETVDVEIDQDVEILHPRKYELRGEGELFEEALAHPIGMNKFGEFASFEKSLLVVVNDGTRPTPTARIIEELYHVLSKHPKVSFIVATGAHRGPTVEEYELIFGKYYEEFKDRIFVHDAKKDEDMVYLGTSSNGTEMYVNKMVTASDKILVIGSVEPHYFAGYTGGRKSFLPGLASYRTIQMNHKHALSNRARALALDGNPVHEDMTDALKNLKGIDVFSIQTVLTGDHKIFAVTAGDLHESFYAAVKEANKIFCVPFKKRGNIVLSMVPYPMDVDLYQSQKAIDNGQFALKSGGVLILVSRCTDGIGEKTYFELLSRCKTPQEALYKINKDYKLGWHKAAKMAQTSVWAKVWAVTNLSPDLLRSINIESHPNVQGAVDEAIKFIKGKGEKPRVILLSNGCLTVPVLEGSEITEGRMRVKTDVRVEDMLEVLDFVLEN